MDDPLTASVPALAPRVALLDALAEESNLTRAAALAGVPQPTASRWLAELGEQLGTPLVTRAGRGIRLTKAGQRLAEAARRAAGELRLGYRAALAEADPERGQVSLAFLHTMGGVRVPELLAGFRTAHPGVRFDLVQGAHEEILQRLRTGEADLVLTAPLPADDPALHTRALAQQPLVAVVPAGHRLATRRRVRLAELAESEFVSLKPGFGLRGIIDGLLAEAGCTPRISFEGEEADTLRGMVAARLGVAVLPESEPLPNPGTVEIPLQSPAFREIGLVWSAERPLLPAVRTFRDYATGARRTP
ncbi:DNA-binding transcriptional LysR family regulator [Amycolatopsis bartoniae]|uniref:LysR family transcriptional regulator n=1 Tax=Amycolatopsis bartoniae TaxID=941986 RepID=A0A8H9IVV0_9PSEU|nr:LysR family transcriptional regulator [Amycolatopsis bartoniae]MBB2936766.1 DNA-binding transcriptional LysR family regulator [Amycolatopsis bartoniae]TVT09185.1 LysR family transcriptional regulator [Amycolatopsis bartoniae]GHF49972.1 LysR family transcriptional regulator [Amycolatopsis bartoniae]